MARLVPTETETAQRNGVLSRILESIKSSTTIKLPPFDPSREEKGGESALLAIAAVPNEYGGAIGAYAYQFEGEDDLLHLFVVRRDPAPLTVEESQDVLDFVLPNLPRALLWLKPGVLSQHYYFGHDLLLESFGRP